LGIATTRQPTFVSEIKGAGAWRITLVEGVDVEEAFLCLSGLFRCRKAKKPGFAACEFAVDVDKMWSLPRCVPDLGFVVAPEYSRGAPVCAVVLGLPGDEVLKLWTTAEGAGEM